RLRSRARLIHADFLATPLPRVDAVIASLSLHHVPTRGAKARMYQRIFETLTANGLFLNVDCCPGTDAPVVANQFRSWRAPLREAYPPAHPAAYFRSWKREDHYTPLSTEVEILARIGFAVEVVWRRGLFAVLAGRRRRGHHGRV